MCVYALMHVCMDGWMCMYVCLFACLFVDSFVCCMFLFVG